MQWPQLRTDIYHLDGSYRDIYVLQTTAQDWRTWIAYVNAHYPVHWRTAEEVSDTVFSAIDADYITQRWGQEHTLTWATIWLGSIEVNCHFFLETQLEQDLDPKQVHSVEDHQLVVNYLVSMSTILGKPVLLTEENTQDAVILRVHGTAVHWQRADFSRKS